MLKCNSLNLSKGTVLHMSKVSCQCSDILFLKIHNINKVVII